MLGLSAKDWRACAVAVVLCFMVGFGAGYLADVSTPDPINPNQVIVTKDATYPPTTE